MLEREGLNKLKLLFIRIANSIALRSVQSHIEEVSIVLHRMGQIY